MKPVRATAEVSCTAADAFAYVSNFENNPEWQQGMQSCTWTSPQPHGVGSTYDQVARFLGKDIVSSFRVVEHQPPQRVKITSTSGPFPITETRIVTPLGDRRCRVEAIVEGDASGFFRLGGPLLRPMVKRSVQGDYRRLAALLSEL